MATSGTFTFANTAASGLTQVAFDRIGIRRGELTTQHLASASIEANLLQVAISGNQPNLWRSAVTPITLTAGTATYNLPTNLVAIQDVYLTTTSGGTSFDRILYAVTLYEYDAQAQKTTQAPPTLYMVQKLLPVTPTITFWQVPDSAATYTANVRYLSQPEDVSQTGGTTLDMPYIYMDAYVAGLAYRMARIYAPDKEQMRRQDWLDALAIAQNTDTQDNTQLFIQPDFSHYQRMR